MSNIDKKIVDLNQELLRAIRDADYFTCCVLDAPDYEDPAESCEYLVVVLDYVYAFKCTREFKFDCGFASITIKKTKEQLADLVTNGLYKKQLFLDERTTEFKDIRKVNHFFRQHKPTDPSTMVMKNKTCLMITCIGLLQFEIVFDGEGNPEDEALCTNSQCDNMLRSCIYLMANGTIKLKVDV